MWKTRLVRFAGLFFISIVLLIALLFVYVRVVSVIHEPQVSTSQLMDHAIDKRGENFYTLGKNWFRKSESGLYELYVEGTAFDRGVANGRLTSELVRHQEKVFTQQINRLVPSEFYLHFLKYAVGWFNRNLADHIPDEYKLEISGVARSASADFEYIAPAYQRMLNYHAAHDIGHALQNMSLVGCTSFATWGGRSEDRSLIIGRNFDFYLGDDFARDKIVAFYRPSEGYNFMMVTFGGMTGVLSGMNDQGLTVTINAAKSKIPSASATPVSLVAREILQYASTIHEAYEIAEKRRLFVAESFLIGSAKDQRAAIIEKSPEGMDLFESSRDYIVCTNHFQGELLGSTKLNIDHMTESASVYRQQRVTQLLERTRLNSVSNTADILRNQLGLDDEPIGLGNEKLINQLVAHHGIIFQPEKGLVWISTFPWQLGRFVCYDLNKVFSLQAREDAEIYEPGLIIEQDPFLQTAEYKCFLKYSPFRFPFTGHGAIHPDSLIKWNPSSYQAYLLAGDHYLRAKEYAQAKAMYERGLTMETATLQEREHMEKNLRKSKARLK